ncbi:hypothetical protein F7734_01920 [Scytonema sp. UIC 10036]|uniref:hypothetical protein n=1 Tax=Scytonema sp. UIC 10036 TaxID=2304196 RepID=UPI0012DA0999|nr:hypothetical protein [Scytonema sp. UIC 10036]MUG91307.1 hypothetical protein [Scytonema sp. UIC 10036]
MPSAKPRITIYIDDEDLTFLRDWAEREDRSVNNLVLRLIKTAIGFERAASSTANNK